MASPSIKRDWTTDLRLAKLALGEFQIKHFKKIIFVIKNILFNYILIHFMIKVSLLNSRMFVQVRVFLMCFKLFLLI